jgi:hypothetical protein
MINHSSIAGVDTESNPYTDRPELQLGFMAMRRKEILNLAKRYEDTIGPIDENTPKDQLIKLMEAFKMQGKFNHAPEQAKDKEIEMLKERLAALEQQAAPVVLDEPEKRGVGRPKKEA